MSERMRPKALLIFLLCSVIAVGVVMLGGSILSGRVDPVSTTAVPVTVNTLPLQAVDSYTIQRRFAARAEPRQQADLAFETSGVITRIDVDEGDRIRAGTIIAQMDTRNLEAMRTQQQAALRALDSDRELARLALERQQNLEDNGFSAAEALDEARLTREKVDAAIAEAQAALTSIDIQIDKSSITAPFSGVVGRRSLDKGATVSSGQSVLTLYDSAEPYVRVGIPPEVIPALKRSATIHLATGSGTQTETDTVTAHIVSVRPDIDVQTRTVSVLLETDEDNETELFFGQLLKLQLDERVSTDAYSVPLTALREGERGLWSILIVVPDEDSDDLLVRQVAVDILHANSDTAYVTGSMNPGSQLITEGRHRVVPGERVQLASPES